MVRIIILTIIVSLFGLFTSLPVDDQLEQEALKAYISGINQNLNVKPEQLSPRDEFKILMETLKADLINRLYEKLREESLGHSSEQNESLMKRSSYKNSAKLAFSGLIGKLHSSG